MNRSRLIISLLAPLAVMSVACGDDPADAGVDDNAAVGVVQDATLADVEQLPPDSTATTAEPSGLEARSGDNTIGGKPNMTVTFNVANNSSPTLSFSGYRGDAPQSTPKASLEPGATDQFVVHETDTLRGIDTGLGYGVAGGDYVNAEVAVPPRATNNIHCSEDGTQHFFRLRYKCTIEHGDTPNAHIVISDNT